MDFSITEEQCELLARLDEFCERNLLEHEIQRWLAEGGVPDSFMLKYYQNDFGTVGLPARMGGTPAPIITRVLMLERLGLHAGATLPIQALMFNTQIIADLADDQQADLMRDMLERTGRPGFSFAVTEPQSGSDSFNVHTIAVEDEQGFVINGAKSFVSWGQYAPYIVLIAHDVTLDGVGENDRKPLTFFLLPRDSEGVDVIPISKMGQHLVPTAEILLDNVRIGKDAVMGERGAGAKELPHIFELGRTYLCATTVGMAQAAFRQAVSFALNRTSFGASIMTFQQVQEMIVDMQVKIDAMRGMLYRVACSFDERSENTRLDTAVLKRFVPETAMEVADSAMQIMGSMGYLSSTRVARVWGECRGNRMAEGTDQMMTVVAARRIAKRFVAEQQDPPVWRF